MNRIKNYLSTWDVARFIRLGLAVALIIAFYYDRETLFLFAGIILAAQAVFNISCPGGSCGTKLSGEDKPVMKFKKYEPKK